MAKITHHKSGYFEVKRGRLEVRVWAHPGWGYTVQWGGCVTENMLVDDFGNLVSAR